MAVRLLPGPFTVDAYHRLAELGILDEADRVELLDVKIPRYAAAGIPEAWLVDLVGDTISVCREPGSEGYGDIVTVSRGEALRPLLLPEVAVAADEILG